MKYFLLSLILTVLLGVGLKVYQIETKQIRYKNCIKDAVGTLRLFPTSLLIIPKNEKEIDRTNEIFGEYLHNIDNYCREQ